jgi:hypothetical protein
MSVEQVESAIQALPPDQRRKLAHWFDEHRHELLKPQERATDEDVESSQQREVLARLAEAEARPESLEEFEEDDLDGMIQEFIHARAKKAPSGQD